MKIKLSAFVTSLFLLCAASSYASEANKALSSGDKSVHWFQPCNSWRVDQNGIGYVCNFPDTTIRVPDADDVNAMKQRISDLEAQLAALTSRVAALESGGSVDMNSAKN